MVIPKKVLNVILIVLILAAAIYFVGGKKMFQSKENQEVGESPGAAGTAAGAAASGAPDQKVEAAPLPVKVEPARREDLVMTLKSPGEAYTERIVALKAEVSGEVKNLYAGEGKVVKAGETLLEIDDSRYRLNLERLEATRLKALSEMFLEKQYAAPEASEVPAAVLERLRTTQAAFEKAAAAFDKGVLPREQYDQARSDYEMALIEAGRKKDEIMATSKNLTQTEIDIKIARMDLAKTKIAAPFAGVLTDIKVSPGERIDAGRELFTLVDLSRIKVKARVLESEIGKMKPGRQVDLRFSAYPDRVFKGTVESVSPVVNSEDKTCAVFILLAGSGGEIRPGMHAEVEIAADIYPGRLLVPQAAVLVRGGRKLVFVVEGDTAKWRYIQTGLENDKFVEVTDGVAEGEPVIVEGHFTLAHDAKVTIQK
jgi:membrane fusion protein (multidrug efflux system)